jgi:hypothetical protein
MTFIGDANDPATILADSDVFYSTYCAASDNDEGAPPGVDWIDASFTESTTPPYWYLGQITSALVQMYDLVAPLDAARAGRYLKRLGRIAGELLANRDDKRGFPADTFRGRVMPAWGARDDHDGTWNTGVVTSGLFTYAMAAFARRVADNTALYAQYEPDAIRFVTATIKTYKAFRPELHLKESDAQAYFVNPLNYPHELAGKPISYNENFSMMKALAEAALAGDSALYRGSANVTPFRLRLATQEAPLLIAKNFTFFDKHLRSKTLSDGTPYFEWEHEQRRSRPGGGTRRTPSSSLVAWRFSSTTRFGSTRCSSVRGEASGSPSVRRCSCASRIPSSARSGSTTSRTRTGSATSSPGT